MKASAVLGFSVVFFAAAAGPPAASSWNDVVRSATEAWERGDAEAAENLLRGTLEHSTDPGIVVFNLGVIAFQRQDWIEAERCFTRSLDDAEAPPDRRARAHYNRAVCLLRRGGLAEYRAAIDGLERCLALAPESNLRNDAEVNLELAKMLWAEARTKAKQTSKPNDPPPNAPPEPEPKPNKSGSGTPPDIDQNDQGTQSGQPKTVENSPPPLKPGAKPKATEKTVGGKGNLPVRIDPATWQPGSEAEAREFLSQLGPRLAKDRRSSAEIHAPPERANVKDW